jgi:iron-sulfur cluster repair protein YtfE (RIC family)
MKRDENLRGLSRQHYDDLLGCLLLKKGINKRTNTKTLKDFTLQFWSNELEPHMQKEEENLLPYLVKHRFSSELINMLKADHELIRIIVERIRMDGEGFRLYEIFSNLVVQHIRYEERVVFQKMQEQLNERELERIGEIFSESRGSSCENYPLKFWE